MLAGVAQCSYQHHCFAVERYISDIICSLVSQIMLLDAFEVLALGYSDVCHSPSLLRYASSHVDGKVIVNPGFCIDGVGLA